MVRPLCPALLCLLTILPICAHAAQETPPASGAQALANAYASRSVAQLIPDLKNPDQRRMAVLALASKGAEAVPGLLDALRSPDRNLRQGATEALREIGAPSVQPLVITAQTDSEAYVRWSAVNTLEGMSAFARDFLGPLGEIARNDKDQGVRVKVVLVLSKLKDPSSVPLLQELLKDPASPFVRARAAEALQNIGKPAATPAIPTLQDALKDTDKRVRVQSALTLVALEADGQPAVPALLEGLTDPALKLQPEAARWLKKLNADFTSAIPALRKQVDSPNRSERMEAVMVLQDLVPDAGDRYPEMQRFWREMRQQHAASDPSPLQAGESKQPASDKGPAK